MKKLIVVLAHPRTGSSLLMQTLRFLNVGILGRFEREDLPQQANPKGYYEDREILGKGLTDWAIERIEQDHNEILAVKIALTGMMRDDRSHQWQYLRKKRATILVTIRPPLESAVSRMVFTNLPDEITRFKLITTFLRNYQLQYKALSKKLLTEVTELLPKTFTINYHTAQHIPDKYIQSIIDSAGLTVSKSQVKDAINNIDPKLYRYNQDSFENNVKEWHRKIGSESYYNILSTQKNPWQIINDSPLYGTS
ncbi:MAG: hypothetical protein IH595_07695 [Bacteroidales bacterium]|nr:hypothetical protein [Bacteroidales bacterium]